jgi:hypothetical protein
VNGRWTALSVIALLCVLVLPAVGQQIPALADVPDDLASARPDLVNKRNQLEQERSSLHSKFEAHNASCSSVDEGSAQEKSCLAAQPPLLSAQQAHISKTNAFNILVHRALAAKSDGRFYQPSGTGLVGGLTWIVGYNVQTTDPAVIAKARAILMEQMKRQGTEFNNGIDFEKYNFVIGIAASTHDYLDLKRVLTEQFRNGQSSAENQKLYNSLKGRQFDELTCHSNGAMTCLAALENKDVMAKHIVLYGPQITPESLFMWNQLVRSGRVNSIKMIVQQGDPVPPVAMLTNPIGSAVTASLGGPFAMLPLFNVDVLSKTVSTIAPSIKVITYPCSNLPSMACHSMESYKEHGRKCPPASGRIVPGTAIPGGRGTFEPPPPC